MLLQLRTKLVASTVFPAKSEEKIHHLLLSEVHEAETRIVKNAQSQTYPEELSSPNVSKSALAKLKPFVNESCELEEDLIAQTSVTMLSIR